MMETQHAPDWVEASSMLRDAMEQYQDQHYYASLPRVIDDVIDYIEEYSGKWLNEKTVKRDVGNRPDKKKFYRIPDWRVRIYAKWLYEKAGKDRHWIAAWLDSTAYSAPGRLLAELSQPDGDIHKMYRAVRQNVPPLKTRLWGRFLGRQEELLRLREWADHQRYPIAVLYGFGGNGKTTIQQKVGEEFVHGIKCPLRWPYEGAVWVSAVDYLRGQPGLQDVLREIAESFHLYPSFSKKEHRYIQTDTLKADVTKLLEKTRVLVLLDNFETISKESQVEILQFFNDLRGASQLLISTRYRPDWFLEQDHNDMYRMAHVLIRVDGLSAEDARTLVHEFLEAKSLPDGLIDEKDIQRLAEMTQHNPKAMLSFLGLVEQGLPLELLVETISSGSTESDRVFDLIIDRAWEHMLSDEAKAVLMAKAFCCHSASEADLGQIAGVEDEQLREALKTLEAIAFFEPEGTTQETRRIRTHALAQEFARRILRDHPDFEREVEERWWSGYARNVVDQASHTPYETLGFDLKEDVANVLERLESHIREQTPYRQQAVELFGAEGGLGHALWSWSRYDDILRVAEPILDFVMQQSDAHLIGNCALRLIAVVCIKRGRVADAQRWIGLAVEQNTRLQDRWLEAVIETTRGMLYNYQGYLRAAKQTYQKALTIFLELENFSDSVAMYKLLGNLSVTIATEALEGAVDAPGALQDELTQAEDYFEQTEALLQQCPQNAQTHETLYELRIQRAILARLRGDFDGARELLQGCIGQLQGSFSVANLYRELALVEYLSGDTKLAHSYEQKGFDLLQQFGLHNLAVTGCYTHCGKVIDRMKEEGTW